MATEGKWTEEGSQLPNAETVIPLNADWSETGSFLIGIETIVTTTLLPNNVNAISNVFLDGDRL